MTDPGQWKSLERSSFVLVFRSPCENLSLCRQDVITFLQDLSSIYHLFVETVRQTALLFADRKRLKKSHILSYVDAIGSFSIPLVLLVSVLIGVGLTVVIAFNLDSLGMLNALPGVVAVAVYRFLAPLLTGSSWPAGWGCVHRPDRHHEGVREILAIETMAINPVRFLVVQRFLGMIIALPALTVLGSFMALFGSFVYCVSHFGMGRTYTSWGSSISLRPPTWYQASSNPCSMQSLS